MGWRGAGGGGAASLPVFIFMGGMLQLIGGFLEFVLGNTFSFVVFSTFGGFWLAFGTTMVPSFGAAAAYAETGGLESPEFAATFGTSSPRNTVEFSKATSDSRISVLSCHHGGSLHYIPHLLSSYECRFNVYPHLHRACLHLTGGHILANFRRECHSGWKAPKGQKFHCQLIYQTEPVTSAEEPSCLLSVSQLGICLRRNY